MMRALYTAATGMMAQQFNMDVISNNLANVNTTGFKRSRADFQDLLHQEIQPAGATVAQGAQSPVGLSVGLGVRPVSTETMFDQGTFQNTSNPLDVAIEGAGFFKLVQSDGSNVYTRDGAFKLDSQGRLVNSDGMQVQPPIIVPPGGTISIGRDGSVTATVNGASQDLGKITTYTFSNPAGLKALGGNNFGESPASGAATEGTPGTQSYGQLAEGTLEMSNVQIVQEMVNMITAQRAYEVNSKAIQTADSMLSTANQLRQ